MPLPCLLAMLLTAAAPPLPVFDFEQPAELAAWRFKANTTLDGHPPAPQQGQGALRLSFQPGEFSFGWAHRPLPAADYGSAVAVTGYWRAPAGSSGQLTLHLCLAGEDGASYFGADLGHLDESDGRWLEFYQPLSALRWERGSRTRLEPARLGPDDLLQLLVSTGETRRVDVDFDSLRFVNATDAAPIAARALRAADARQLLPSPAPTAPPHPRLLLTADALPAYRARIAGEPELQAALTRLTALADGIVAGPWAADPVGPIFKFAESSTATGREFSAPFEGVLVNAVRPLEVVAAAWQLTGDAKYADAGRRALVAAARRLTAQTPFLDQGFFYTRTFYVRALAFGYDWLYDRLTPDERRDVQTTLVGFIQNVHGQSQTATWGRRPLQRVWNWDPGIMSACGLALLAVEGETRLPERSMLFDCRRHLRDYLTLGIDEDGCGHEGPGYLGYGIGAGPEFAEVLRRRGWGDLFTETNYRLIPAWLISEMLPDRKRWNNLSDCGHGEAPWPVYQYAAGRLAELAASDPARPGERWPVQHVRAPLDYLAHFLDRPGDRPLSYATLAGLMAWAWRNGPGSAPVTDWEGQYVLAHLLLFRPLPPSLDPAAVLPLGVHFRGRGLIVSRTGFGRDDLHLEVEAGPHAAGHDQADKGTFTLGCYGADLAIDSGYGNDSDPHKSTSSYAHNVVLIDGRGQPMSGHNQSGGYVTGFHHDDRLDWLRVDAKEAWSVRYNTDLVPTPTTPVRRAERSLVLVRPDGDVPPYLVVYDSLDQDGAEHDYTWQWHIPGSLAFATDTTPWVASPRAPRYTVLTTAADKAAGSASWRMTVPAGRYRLFGLVAAGGEELGKSDSFFVQVDDGPKLTWDLKTSADLTWSQVSDRGDAAERRFDLTAGEHTLTLSAREPQAEFARWALVPDGAAPPKDPDAAPAGAVLLETSAAQMGPTPLLTRAPGAARGPQVSLEVTPVHPTGGKVTTDWFETSQEGSHPRLHDTVRAVDPRFLVVLVPRREGVPRPTIRPLAVDGGVGCEVVWPTSTDRLVFAGPEHQVTGAVTLAGSAAWVRERGGAVRSWALLDGTRLAAGGQVLAERPAPVVEVVSR